MNVQSETEVAECAIEVCALNGLGVHLKFNVLDNPVDTLWYFQGKVARLHERIANQRNDTIHKATTRAVRESQGIACESLNVKGMLRNHKSARSVSDAAMGEMIRQLAYKCRWYGREFRQVDTFFPSTQTCGCCGAITGPKGHEGLHMRVWDCPECRAHHDRDLNAARNILRKAYELG